MKTAFKILAWIGIILTVPFILWGFYNVYLMIQQTISPPPPGYFNETGAITLLALIIFWLGTIFIVIGGSVSKPGHFASASILVGFLHVSLNFGLGIQFIQEHGLLGVTTLMLYSLSGLICIIEGVILKVVENRAIKMQ